MFIEMYYVMKIKFLLIKIRATNFKKQNGEVENFFVQFFFWFCDFRNRQHNKTQKIDQKVFG